jgi:hypothetical protein
MLPFIRLLFVPFGVGIRRGERLQNELSRLAG